MKTSKQKKKKIILLSLSAGAVGVLGYLGWQHFLKRRRTDSDDLLLPQVPSSTYVKPSSDSYKNDSFPLKRGSRGERVRQIQLALINRYGTSALPRYGSDGDFGTETENALLKNGFPKLIDSVVFNQITSGTSSNQGAGFNPESLAKSLWSAAVARNFSGVISGLRKLQTVSDYSLVGNYFKQYRVNGVRQTLVNALLGAFSGSQKEQVQMEFTRIGLKYNGSQWSLSGLSSKTLITKCPALVWSSASKSVRVPSRVILGKEMSRRKGFCLFKNPQNKLFIVKSDSVKYL